ncbi:MAG: hypothetical protein U9O87_02805 [Verrucomicrobiota bacterium]|nr:hypothetical protein [Verrucomicrobiota bacterium]
MNEDSLKFDRSIISATTLQSAEKKDKEYWLSKTPEERFIALQKMREICYGNQARKRLQRVFEFVKQT